VNSRERLEAALNHKEPDRVPSDLGGTVLSSINHDVYRKLRHHLGLPTTEVRMADIVQQMAIVDDDVRQFIKVDARDVAPRSSASFNIGIKDDMPDYTYFHDEWGIGVSGKAARGWTTQFLAEAGVF
jgi:uroporphyrinogen decarboxylase